VLQIHILHPVLSSDFGLVIHTFFNWALLGLFDLRVHWFHSYWTNRKSLFRIYDFFFHLVDYIQVFYQYWFWDCCTVYSRMTNTA
jgi:hypothetical protein